MRRTYKRISATMIAALGFMHAVPDDFLQIQRSSAARCRRSLPAPVRAAGLHACPRCSLDSLPTLFAVKKLARMGAQMPYKPFWFGQGVMRSEPSPRCNLMPTSPHLPGTWHGARVENHQTNPSAMRSNTCIRLGLVEIFMASSPHVSTRNGISAGGRHGPQRSRGISIHQ